jgi:MFS family permease
MNLIKKKLLSDRLFLILSLFIIGGALHYIIFRFVQSPDLLPEKLKDLSPQIRLSLVSLLIISELLGTIINQTLARFIGLKKVLILGFLFNLFGLICFLFIISGWGALNILYTLLFLKTFFMGFALTTVLVSVLSYIIYELPEKIGTGILVYFAFGNIGGFVVFPFFYNLCTTHNLGFLFISLLIFITIASVFFINVTFFEPHLPKHLSHFRKGTLIWKELHYRLVLFLIVGVLFSIMENAFSAGGFVHLNRFFDPFLSYKLISIFWTFVIISQFFLSFLILFIDFRHLFYFLVVMILSALWLFPYQTSLGGLIFVFAIAGIGCSGSFAIILSGLEKELIYIARRYHHLAFLPTIECTVALMLGAYFLGEGLINLKIELLDNLKNVDISSDFKITVFLGIIMLAIISFLFYTTSLKTEQKDKS